jgi:hypothetical protein
VIACLLMHDFSSSATTASLSHCNFIVQTLDLVVQVPSGCRTAYISLKLTCFAVCRHGTVVLKSWVGVCMLERVSPGPRKLFPILFYPDVSVHSGKICHGRCRSLIAFHCRGIVCHQAWSFIIYHETRMS